MRRSIQAVAAATLALTTASACGGGHDEHAAHQHGPPPAQAQPPAGMEGPRVPAPLNTQALANDPCAALAPAQLDQLGMATPGNSRPSPVGPSCSWNSSADRSNGASISPMIPNKGGISDIYAQKAGMQYFEPTQIAGYPAVYASQADLRPRGTCTLNVGVTDQLSMVVMTIIPNGPNKAKTCQSAEKIATAMVEHAKGKA